MLDRNFASCLVLEHRCLGVGRRKRTRTHSCNNHHNHNERLTSGAFPHSDKEGAPTATTASSVTSNDHDERFDLSHPANEAEGETSSSSSHVTMMIKIQQRLTLPCVIIGMANVQRFLDEAMKAMTRAGPLLKRILDISNAGELGVHYYRVHWN